MSIANFKARSHILTLLGDELIGNDALAIFELVKNSYDADAENVSIKFKDIGYDNISLTIKDDGHGMDKKTIIDVWLTLGTDFKRGEKRKRSEKYRRVSLGNKGIGRLAVHKIATKIKMKTKKSHEDIAYEVSIDWKDLIDSEEFVQDLTVEIRDIEPTLSDFPNGQGTIIELEGFKDLNWNKAKVRKFYRMIDSIKNPFEDVDNFNISMNLGDKNEWIDGIKSSRNILDNSLYKFNFILRRSKIGEVNYPKAKFEWHYQFAPHKALMKNAKVDNELEEKSDGKSENIFIGDLFSEYDFSVFDRFLYNYDLDKIGDLKGAFYVFNLNPLIFNQYFPNEINAVKDYINNNYGIKVYRDNIRVFNYGEPSDDWLSLDLKKIRRGGDHFARKVTIGYLSLDLEQSEKGLTEKTNREGFDENKHFDKLKILSSFIFNIFETKAKDDRDKILEYLEGFKPVKNVGLSDTIERLSEKIKDGKLEEELLPLVKKIEHEYESMKSIMMSSGMAGLNLAIIFHEVDRELHYVDRVINEADLSKNNNDIILDLRIKISSLTSLLKSFSPLLKQSINNKKDAGYLINKALNVNKGRFEHHNIIYSSPILSSEDENFDINGPSSLILSSINNIIDNSVYWLGVESSQSERKAIYISTDLESFNGNAIIIADNGLGFSVESDYAIRPFATSKPGGMGMGLYLANLVMETIGGKLMIIDPSDVEIPKVYNGACIALIFPKDE